MRRAIAVTALSAALVLGGASMAAAAPPEPEIIPVVCDDGQTYLVASAGNGQFTPGRVIDGTGVLIPVSFGDFTFRAVDPVTGEVLVEFTEPGGDKGGGNVALRSPRPTLSCTFEVTEVLEEEDPESGLPAGTEVTFGGEVTVFQTPAS